MSTAAAAAVIGEWLLSVVTLVHGLGKVEGTKLGSMSELGNIPFGFF